MQLLRHIFNFYINSSIHVALAVFCLSCLTLIEFNIKYNENILLFIFFATITGYNFVKYFGIAKFHHRRLTQKLKIIQVFSLICFVFLCYYAIKLNTNTIYFIAILGAVTFLYTIPFLPKKILLDEAMNLRKISGLKIYVIAFVWSCVTVVLPLIDSGIAFDWNVIITGIQRFIYVLVVMLPFEIRDMGYDSIKLSTIPQQIGIRNSKIIGVLLLMPFFFLEFFKDDISPISITALLIVTVFMAIAVLLAKINQPEYYASFWVEGIPIVWLLISWIGITYL
ncbi:MAG: hypothetical protein HKN96_06140 [Flavobacteriaceae bacterium]|nr:hypothetical protein [Bacteroidia bacterium]NND10770.1 hypothetical protein [Flavobacteriaceae bacterium]NNL61603.1 hypothetical protein [Flavobacteriaceae bacterium]